MSVPTVTASFDPLSAATVNVELVVAVLADVILPSTSIVITGIAELEPYEAADTPLDVNCVAPIEPSAISAEVIALTAMCAVSILRSV